MNNCTCDHSKLIFNAVKLAFDLALYRLSECGKVIEEGGKAGDIPVGSLLAFERLGLDMLKRDYEAILYTPYTALQALWQHMATEMLQNCYEARRRYLDDLHAKDTDNWIVEYLTNLSEADRQRRESEESQ